MVTRSIVCILQALAGMVFYAVYILRFAEWFQLTCEIDSTLAFKVLVKIHFIHLFSWFF